MQFNKPDLNNLQNYLNENQNSGGGGDINWWSLPMGVSSIRVLPPWDPTGRIALAVYSHRIEYKEPDSNYTKYSWTCVHRTFGKPCNICEGLNRIQQAGVNVSEYLPESITWYINALVMFDPAYDNAVKMGRDPKGTMAPYTHVLMRIPKTIYTWIVNQITSPLIGDITDPVNGIDVIVTREGTGLNTRYQATLSPNGKTAIPEEVLNSLELYNLDEVFGTGFDNERIERMVNSLHSSATGISQGIPQTQQQMGGIPSYGAMPQGYGTGVANPQQTMVPPTPPMPNPQYAPAQQSTTISQTPPSPYMNNVQQPLRPPQTPPQTQQAPPQPATMQQPVQPPQAPQTPNSGVQYPKCFGTYNPANVNCVVCGFEVECSQKG